MTTTPTADQLTDQASIARRRAAMCIAAGALLVAVSSSYNLRSAAPTVFGVLTFLLPPVAIGVAVWLAHTAGGGLLAGGAVTAAVTAFGLSSIHIYEGATLDGAPWYHAAALPFIIDGLAIMLTVGYLRFRALARDAGSRAAELRASPGAEQGKARRSRPTPRKRPAASSSAGQPETPRSARLELAPGPTAPTDTKAEARAEARRLAGHGLQQAEIAERLNVSVRTVRRYLNEENAA